MRKEIATFAMGCFWKPDVLFSKIKGVIKTEVGYMGGNEQKYPRPSYEQVCKEDTDYAEVVQVTFDSDKVGFSKIIEVFWKNHNPTTINRQGLDIGKQYRSAVFYHNEKQKEIAEKTKILEQKNWKNQIVTEIVKAEKFFKAEDYHQKYLEKNNGAYC